MSRIVTPRLRQIFQWPDRQNILRRRVACQSPRYVGQMQAAEHFEGISQHLSKLVNRVQSWAVRTWTLLWGRTCFFSVLTTTAVSGLSSSRFSSDQCDRRMESYLSRCDQFGRSRATSAWPSSGENKGQSGFLRDVCPVWPDYRTTPESFTGRPNS